MRREIGKDLGCGLLGGFAVWLVLYSAGPPSPGLIALCGEDAARTAQVLCFLGLGLGAGLISLLWKWEGGFAVKSAADFLIMGAGLGLWHLAVHGWPWSLYLAGGWLGMTISCFLLDWVLRFLTYRRDVEQIRAKLGLPAPAASPLKWRETLPDLCLTAVLFALLRPLLWLLDGQDVPVFTGLILPWLLWPFLAAVLGFGTGHRCGFTLLLPLTVGISFLPNLLYTAVPYSWTMAVVYAALALAGSLLGAAARRKAQRGDADRGTPGPPP